jgi:hypothetical protein
MRKAARGSKSWFLAALGALVFSGWGQVAAQEMAPTPEWSAFFESRIRPILVERCYECHSSQAKSLESNYSLETRESLIKGGDRGPAVVPGKPEESPLVAAVRRSDPDFQMPPDEPLSAEEVADLEAWVAMGAPDPRTGAAVVRRRLTPAEARETWPYSPLARPPIPEVSNPAWARSSIDRFILAGLDARGLRPAGDASPRVLLRRVSYDLIGLPPTPEETARFLADKSPAAFERLVDRLLASPRYGERWGRHWMDVVRYSDTAGDNSDFPIPQMIRYRDWIIDALNADMPYGEFVKQQIAGDLMPAECDEERRAKIVATGYIASARRFGSTVDDYPQHLTIEDTIDNLGRAFLGLSLNCARCHDHKFDPISTEDYYGLYGIFHSTRYPWPGIELEKRQRDLVPLVSVDVVEKARRERNREKERMDSLVRQFEAEKKAADEALGRLREREKEGGLTPEQLEEAGRDLARLDELFKAARRDRERLDSIPMPYDTAYAVAEGAKREDVMVQIKGNPQNTGEMIERRFPEVMGGHRLPPDQKGSGRLELAEWVASPENSLALRVMANRVWHFHFGRGLVPTPNDFGRQGQPPTHPELLDHLAGLLVESGGSIKALHRAILLSRVYQLAAGEGERAATVDPTNAALSHFPVRRLDAEAIRDTLLFASGSLDPVPGEAHPFPPQPDWNFTQHNPFKAVYPSNHRSVYLMIQRIQRNPFLALFDGADPAASTAARSTSTTPLQALYFMNDPWVREQADRLARRVQAEAEDDRGRVVRLFEILYGRPPEPEETELVLAFVESAAKDLGGTDASRRTAWQSAVHGVLSSSEWIYVE